MTRPTPHTSHTEHMRRNDHRQRGRRRPVPRPRKWRKSSGRNFPRSRESPDCESRFPPHGIGVARHPWCRGRFILGVVGGRPSRWRAAPSRRFAVRSRAFRRSAHGWAFLRATRPAAGMRDGRWRGEVGDAKVRGRDGRWRGVGGDAKVRGRDGRWRGVGGDAKVRGRDGRRSGWETWSPARPRTRSAALPGAPGVGGRPSRRRRRSPRCVVR
jgi:hypothetical protein